MGTLTAPEIRGPQLSPKERAIICDDRVREIDRVVRESWSELAAICIQVRDKELWKLLPPRLTLDVDGSEPLAHSKMCIEVSLKQGLKCSCGARAVLDFHSFDDWLIDAAPCCRATVYKGMGVLSVIAKDLSPEEIAGIEIGNAALLAQVSSSVRRDPEVIEAAKSGRNSKKLRDVVNAKFPDQHLDTMHEEKTRWPDSAWEVIEEALAAYRHFEDDSISFASWIEWMANDYLDTQHGTVTTRQAYREAIKARRNSKD